MFRVIGGRQWHVKVAFTLALCSSSRSSTGKRGSKCSPTLSMAAEVAPAPQQGPRIYVLTAANTGARLVPIGSWDAVIHGRKQDHCLDWQTLGCLDWQTLGSRIPVLSSTPAALGCCHRVASYHRLLLLTHDQTAGLHMHRAQRPSSS